MMRSGLLSVCVPTALMLSAGSVGQTPQQHSPDHLLQLVGARQLAVKPFKALPKGALYLRFENFSTMEAARSTATSASAAVEWAGKQWLITLGPKGGRSRGATLVTEIGPLPPVPLAASYVLDVNAAQFGPDMKALVARQVHTHPGPEIFYLLTGEQCLETPTGTTRASAGEGMVAPANTPMQLNIVGAETRNAFFVIIHDSKKPRVTPSDWQPTGACAK